MTAQHLSPLGDTSPFIDLELYTVPLNGQYIKRNEQGKKHGYSFTSNWQENYSNHMNELPTPIGGILTGKGGLVAIDCDDTASYNLFRDLDPTYTAVFDSIGKLDKDGKPILACTILYKHEEDLPSSKHLKGDLDIDWYNGTGMVFLPTAPNTTKATWHSDIEGRLYNHNKELVEFKPMPAVVKQVLNLILTREAPQQTKSVADTTFSKPTRGFRGSQLDGFDLKGDEYDLTLMNLLTPNEYKNALYHKQGHIHPQDVGVRHDYLFKIMCILAGDNTVDKDMAIDAIMWVNRQLDPPRSSKQMHKEVIDGIISGRQKNPSGEPYWEYDENWELNKSWTAVAKTSFDLLHIFYDTQSMTYYVYNTIQHTVLPFTKETQLVKHIQASTIGGFSVKDVIADMHNVKVVVEPTEDYGYLSNDTEFNSFKPTRALRILADPHQHEQDYKEPIEFMAYMEHFIPDEQQRSYFLSLIRTKLTTFDYSPVVPYIIGVPGSGKGILMTVLAKLLDPRYVSENVPAHEFTSQFNKGWLENKWFVNLNELAEGLANVQERRHAQGLLKLYSGADNFQCTGKGKDPYTAPQRAMFIMTANHNPLPIEDNDRRIYYIATPNTFISSPQCVASKNSKAIYDAIMAQIDDIAYYLATEIENVSDNDYTTAPHHSGRAGIIFDSLNIAEKMVWALDKGEFRLLEDYLLNGDPIFETSDEGRVYLAGMVEAYEQLGNSENPDKLIKSMMKKYGFKQHQGSKNAVYWTVNDLDNYKSTAKELEDNDAQPIRI